MKPFSLLDIYDCKAYLRVDFDFDDYLIEMMLDAAKSYVKNYTKRTQEDLDKIPEVSLCVLVIMAHLYDHRTLEADSDVIDYTPINFNQLMKSGPTSKIETIHRTTIDKATKKKKQRGK